MKTEADDSDARSCIERERRPCERRERALEVIRDSADAMSVSELAGAVLEQGAGHGRADRRRVEVYLHHVDLPKLREQGEIEYYPSLGLVL